MRQYYAAMALAWASVVSMPAAAEDLDAPLASDVSQIMNTIISASPINLPRATWKPYSQCLLSSLADATPTHYRDAVSALALYIGTFDSHGSPVSNKMESLLNDAVVVPCLPLNPIYAMESRHAGASPQH